MNICILSTRYPYKGNMVHVFVKKLVDEWAKEGHRCVVISPLSRSKILLGKETNLPYYEKQEICPGIFVELYRPRFWHLPNIRIFDVSLTSRSIQNAIDRTIACTKIKFDFIYGHFFSMASKGWRYANNNNIPLFAATGESVVTMPVKPCKNFTIDGFRQGLCGVIAVSSKNKKEASSMGIINPGETKVFPNGVNLELFKKMNKKECRKLLNLPKDSFIIICVGQFIERKGQKRILAALDKLKITDIKTIFLGKGDDDFKHESIIYKGMAKNDKLPYYLNASDLFVLPTRKEGCCNAIVEALACGLPIISSDCDFNYDVLNKRNAILVNPDNIDEIADAIETIYSNPEYAASLSDAAYKQGQKLSITQRAKDILQFINFQINKQNG